MRAFRVVRALLDRATCERAAVAFDAALARARRGELAPADWVPTGSSLRWRALPMLDPAAMGGLCAALRAAGALPPEGTFEPDLAIAWWRCQYPPALAPGGHHPHAWHQDGALGFDFAARPEGAAGALRPLVTCWITLVPCGADAPGLELLDRPCDRVLGLADLADGALRAAHPQAAFATPVLGAGDALVFDGGVVHRTHVAPAMTRVRASLELRFVSPPACAPRSGP